MEPRRIHPGRALRRARELIGPTALRVAERTGSRLGRWCVLLGALGLWGCTTTDGLVRSAAAEEFRCDERAIRVTYLGDDHYEAVGCGKRERYAFHDRETCPSGRCPFR